MPEGIRVDTYDRGSNQPPLIAETVNTKQVMGPLCKQLVAAVMANDPILEAQIKAEIHNALGLLRR